MPVRQLTPDDFDQALRLYRVLTRDPVPVSVNPQDFEALLSHPGTTVFGMDNGAEITSMITLHLLPNMTSGGRPYGVVENVVTDSVHRGKGMAKAVMQSVVEHAQRNNAYKIMLLTGTARDALGFYQKMGFSGHEKHGLVLRF